MCPPRGAALLVLESLEHALDRGAEIVAEVIGQGVSSDAHHPVQPEEDGAGAARSIRWALEDARIRPEDVDYINAHGTSTPLNDLAETRAIKTALGEHAYKAPISSTKSMIGHALGGAGALEAVAAIKTIVEGEIHPTINYEYPDPECDLDYVPNEPRTQRVDTALSNSFGFGGAERLPRAAALRGAGRGIAYPARKGMSRVAGVHTETTDYADELMSAPRAHLALELAQDDGGLKLSHEGKAVVECRLTREGMIAAAYMAQALGTRGAAAGRVGEGAGLHGSPVPGSLHREPRLQQRCLIRAVGALARGGGSSSAAARATSDHDAKYG